MKKNINSKSLNPKPNNEESVVFIRLRFGDGIDEYGYYDFVVDFDYLKNEIEEFLEMSHTGKITRRKSYDEILKVRFIPKMDFEKFGLSVSNYICSHFDLILGFDGEPLDGKFIQLYINVKDDKSSSLWVEPVERYTDFPHLSHFVGKTKVRISFRSKLELLDEEIKESYFNLVKSLEFDESGTIDLTCTEDLFYFFGEEPEWDEEHIDWDEVPYMLCALEDHGLINSQFIERDEENYQRMKITICDYDIVSEYLDSMKNPAPGIDDLYDSCFFN